jgi:hypothetical protein
MDKPTDKATAKTTAKAIAQIQAAFKEYFDEFDLELPKTLKEKGTIQQGGWSITYVLTREGDDQPALDFFAEHRLTNPRLIRIHPDGRVEEVASLQENFGFDPDVAGDQQRAEKEFQEHNDRFAKLLEERGLL